MESRLCANKAWRVTIEEIKTIPIHWIDCHVEDIEIENGTKPVCREPVQQADAINILDTSMAETDT
eukprot:13506247-Ditylum_brightwellii.AAC.1